MSCSFTGVGLSEGKIEYKIEDGTFILNYDFRNAEGCVCRHLHISEMPSGKAQLPEFGCAVSRWIITCTALFMHMHTHFFC